MLKAILLASALQLALNSAALACEGQAGATIYEDLFADDAGGWDMAPPGPTFEPSAMVLAPGADGGVNIHSHVLTFNASDGDYCAEFVLPPAPAADNLVGFGIEFWAVDYRNLMALILTSDKSLGFWKLADGTWSQIALIPDAPGFIDTPGATNSMRIITKAGRITLMLNGTEVKSIRAQVPTGNLRFGVYAQVDKSLDVPPVIKVSSFVVTAGE